MSHGPAETIEHAQHASHASHDGYDKLVTITIAILAAGLAYVSILSHKTHNEVLSQQINAGIDSNKGANKWAQYQATNIRFHSYKTQVELAESDPNEAQKGEIENAPAARLNRASDSTSEYLATWRQHPRFQSRCWRGHPMTFVSGRWPVSLHRSL